MTNTGDDESTSDLLGDASLGIQYPMSVRMNESATIINEAGDGSTQQMQIDSTELSVGGRKITHSYGALRRGDR